MSHIVKFQFLISSVDQLLIISPGHCMPLNSYKLHLVIYFYPISPTKIFMPVCIFRFYQYVESLTWGTLKQVIRVYCTIKSMTFLKIFSFGDKVFISVTLFMVHWLSKTHNVFIFLYSFYLSMNISVILIFCWKENKQKIHTCYISLGHWSYSVDLGSLC